MNKKLKQLNLDDRFSYCSKKGHGVFLKTLGCARCSMDKRRKEQGLCLAILNHGPGHQSKTYCQVNGKHRIHSCVYGRYDQEMQWKSMSAFTGRFDEPQEII